MVATRGQIGNKKPKRTTRSGRELVPTANTGGEEVVKAGTSKVSFLFMFIWKNERKFTLILGQKLLGSGEKSTESEYSGQEGRS